MSERIKIIVSILVIVVTSSIVAACSSFKNGRDVNFQLETPPPGKYNCFQTVINAKPSLQRRI